MRFATPLFAALLAAYAATATAQTPITLDQAMANPDWIGTPVDAAWWGWDSHQVYYSQKRLGAALHDTYAIAGGPAKLVGDAQLANADAANMVYNRDHTRAIVLRNGDLFERDLKNGALVQIVRGSTAAADPQYAADGKHVQFRVGNDWFSWSRSERLVTPVALLRTAKDPDAAPEADALRDMQLRLMTTLARVKSERDAKREQSNEERRADATRAPLPVYLGEKTVLKGSALSPDGRYLIVVTADKESDKGKKDKLAKFVTESGFEESVDQRERSVHELSYDVLPGIKDDPLADMRKAQKLDPIKGNRTVRIDPEDGVIQWSRNGAQVAVMIRSIDNKDRWIASVDLAGAKLKPLHRLTDAAWVNYRGNDFGWLPDNSTLWFMSEESG